MEPTSTLVRMVRQSSVYALATLAQRAAGFFMLPVYTRYLTASDYGVLELLDLTVSIVGYVIGVRLSAALFYFQAELGGDQRRRAELLSTAVFGALVLGSIAAAIGVCAAPQLSKLVFQQSHYERYFRLFFIRFACDFVIEVGYSHMRLLDRPWTYFRVSVAHLSGQLILSAVLLIHFHAGIMAILVSSVATAFALAIYMAWYVLRGVKIGFHLPTFFAMARYSAPLGVSSLAMFLLHFGDRYFLSRAASLADVGVYAAGYKIGMLVAYIQTTFTLFWHSQMFLIVRGPEGDRTYCRVCTYLTLVLATACVLLTVLSRPAVILFLGPDFQRLGTFVPAIAAAYVIRGTGEYFTSALYIENKTGHILVATWTAAAACAGSCMLLIPSFKLWGAVAATLIGFGTLFAVSYWNAQKVRHFDFEIGRLLKILASMLAVIAVHFTFRPATLWPQCLMAAALALAFTVLLDALGFLEKDEKQRLSAALRFILTTGRSNVHVCPDERRRTR